ncbi:mariner Mos1 transposase [Trichonephila clavipes]|nr:mariner Mos1 transposase [Trichonephila clavipes]
MVNTHHRLEHVRHGLGNFKSGDFKNAERHTHTHTHTESSFNKSGKTSNYRILLDDDPTQTQQQLAKALNVSQETISRRLRATGKINKLGKWVPHDLNERQMENRKVTCELLLQSHERKSFLY